MNREIEKQLAAKVYAHVAELFNEDCENYINIGEVADNGNANELMLVLSTIVPAIIYNRLTDEEVDMLGFNHIMNRLIHQSKDSAES